MNLISNGMERRTRHIHSNATYKNSKKRKCLAVIEEEGINEDNVKEEMMKHI